MSKRMDHGFVFYPGDWLRDPELRSCSMAARALWIDLLCFMHSANVRGVLPGDPQRISNMTGLPLDTVKALMKELEICLVFAWGKNVSKDLPEDAIVNRRMWREGIISAERSEAGRKGGNKRVENSISDKNCQANGKQNASKCQATNTNTNTNTYIKDTPYPLNEIHAAWNETAKVAELPIAKDLTAKRKTALKARLKEQSFRDNWQEAIQRIPSCRFLRGFNTQAWKADFDWFLKPDSVTKILEGKYDDRNKPVRDGVCAGDYDAILGNDITIGAS